MYLFQEFLPALLYEIKFDQGGYALNLGPAKKKKKKKKKNNQFPLASHTKTKATHATEGKFA
jgi:hypothetical protein